MLSSFSLSWVRARSFLVALVVLLFGAGLLSVPVARADDDDTADDDDDDSADDDDSSASSWSQGAAQAAGDLSGCSCGESVVGMNASVPSKGLLVLTLALAAVASRRRRLIDQP